MMAMCTRVRHCVILLLVFVVGCAAIAWSANRMSEQVRGVGRFALPEDALLFATSVNVRVWRGGRVENIGPNPAGFGSLDYWLGYLPKAHAVLFRRSDDPQIRLFGVDLAKKRLAANPRTLQLEGGDDETHHPALDSSSGTLSEIRGDNRAAELWQCPWTGKWKRTDSWVVPASTTLSAKWSGSPGISGKRVVFASPSGFLLMARRGEPEVSILYTPDTKWRFQGGMDETIVPEGCTPVFSPDGSHIAWTRIYAKDGMVGVVNLHDKTYLEYRVNKAVGGLLLAGGLRKVDWLRNGYLVCELPWVESGMSDLYIVDISSERTQHLPISVMPDQWCVVRDAPSLSSE